MFLHAHDDLDEDGGDDDGEPKELIKERGGETDRKRGRERDRKRGRERNRKRKSTEEREWEGWKGI